MYIWLLIENNKTTDYLSHFAVTLNI